MTEENVNELEDKATKIIQPEKKRGKKDRKKKQPSLKDLQDNIKKSNIHVTEIPE